MNNMSIDLTNFNYNAFKAEAIEKIKSGQPLTADITQSARERKTNGRRSGLSCKDQTLFR